MVAVAWLVGITSVIISAYLAHHNKRQKGANIIAAIEREVANGWNIDFEAKPGTLNATDRSRYALQPNSSYRTVDLSSGEWTGIIPGGEAWGEVDGGAQGGGEEVRSPWAVWATTPLLSRDECNEWVRRFVPSSNNDDHGGFDNGEWDTNNNDDGTGAEKKLELETGDFIFAGGPWGLSRLHTGARRHSATKLVEDSDFSALMEHRLKGQVPEELADGRKYGGVTTSSFLVSKYEPNQYFAPHFDGRGSGRFSDTHTAEFTVVLYLTDDFVGGATHYLPGQGSEVTQAVALRPNLGCATVHRQGTVLHSGGRVLDGTKYIMQFFLYYESGVSEPREMTNLRWGA